MTRLHLSQLIRRGDIIRVETYFQSEGRIGARRDWVLTDVATGAQIGCATSSWVMFNYKTRRMGRMPKDAREAYESLMPDPPQHSIDAAETRLKLPELTGNVPLSRHTASPVYMDMNKHLNNAAYLTWILDSIPDELLSTRILVQYEVDYKAEGIAGALAYGLHAKCTTFHMPHAAFCPVSSTAQPWCKEFADACRN